MITIILFAILGLVISIIKFWTYLEWQFSQILGHIIVSIFFIFIFSIAGFVVAYILPMDTETKIDTYKIICLQDNNDQSGKLFLGTGSIEGKMKYVFYYQEDSIYKLKQIDCENASIILSDSARVERYRKEKTKAFINYFALDDLCEHSMMFVIYVPKGSIKNNYNLDAQ
jgi:hypothetical protein